MKDVYDKLKIISDIVKDNKVLVLMLFTSIGSLSTGGWQWLDKYDIKRQAGIDKDKAVHEVAKGFQAAMVEVEPKEVVIKSTCRPCGFYLNKHEKELH